MGWSPMTTGPTEEIFMCVCAHDKSGKQEAMGWYLYGILLCDRGEHAHVLLPILDVLPHYLVYVLYLLNR